MWVNSMCNKTALLEIALSKLVSAFLENARRFPKQEAVVEGERSITYAELDAVSNRIALHLQQTYRNTANATVQVVGVALPRSIENIACWLGAAKAGIAYAPIAQDWPQARIWNIVRRCQIKVVITCAEWADVIPDEWPVDVLDVAALCGVAEEAPEIEARCVRADEGALPLYVIHTSGSTGEPKSVALTHENAYAVLRDPAEFGVRRHDRMAHVIAVTFDLSMMEVWGALLHAGTIVVTETNITLDAERLKIHIARFGIRWAILSTGVFNVLSTQDASVLKAMRDVCICGEMPNREAIMRVCAACPETTILNCYGPAECTIYVTRERITPQSLEPAVVPAGLPICGAEIMIADDDMTVLPCTEVGEVLIGGPCVGLGYLGDEERTARAFVNVPGVSGRVYRTGDYGSVDAHGRLTVLGRKDNQVKVSGRRVELGEICSTVMGAPDVKMAFIALTQGAEKELAAYIIPSSVAVLEDATLRAQFMATLKDHMLAHLPEYMAPRHYMLVETLPLNAHGKVDRARLPEVTAQTGLSDGSILGMFRDVLGYGDFGFQDSFFEMGGTSIKAARLIGEIRQATKVPVPFSLLLEEHTAAKVQAYVDAARAADGDGLEAPREAAPVKFSFRRRVNRSAAHVKASGNER